MTLVVFSLGSNLGDRAGQLRAAVAGLAQAGELRAVSGVYETPPWGDRDQPSYYNAVALVSGDHEMKGWLEIAHRLEEQEGRIRDEKRRFAPRTLDIDLIAAWTDTGAAILADDPVLTLPHPRAKLRAFVLRPWLEIQPYAQLPGHGWVNELVLAPELADDVAQMIALPAIRLEPEPLESDP